MSHVFSLHSIAQRTKICKCLPKVCQKLLEHQFLRKKLSKKFIKTIVTGNNILYNTLTNADAFDVAKTHHVQAIFAKNDHISHDFQDGLSRNTNPAWYDRFYKMRQLRFVKGDCVQMLISGYYGFRVESKNVFAFR